MDLTVRYISADTGDEITKKAKALYSVGVLIAFSASSDYLVPWHRITSVEGPINFLTYEPMIR